MINLTIWEIIAITKNIGCILGMLLIPAINIAVNNTIYGPV